jgi:Domain of unknown function (DUF4291)
MSDMPQHQIRAVYDEHTIRVYQAYNDEIADVALSNGTFVSPSFKMNRMTWIKPSFLWMMYRSGWGFKDEGQRRILAIDVSRDGFEWALAHSCPSHPEPSMSWEDWTTLKSASPVRIQWDPRAGPASPTPEPSRYSDRRRRGGSSSLRQPMDSEDR